MFNNKSLLQGIYASSGFEGVITGTYSSLLNVISIQQLPGQSPTPPCPRINLWRDPDFVGPFITAPGLYTLDANNVPINLSSGIDIFSWRLPSLQTVTINVSGGVQGVDYEIEQSFIENNTQVKTQIRYLKYGTYQLSVSILN